VNSTMKLAEFVASIRYEQLPIDVVRMAKRCIRDSLGCALGGYATRSGRIVADLVAHMGGREEATLLGAGIRVPAPLGAFANAHLTNVLDFDDTCEGHPGATVVPSALASAECFGVDGGRFVAAVVAGYETSIRVMSAYQPCGGRFVAAWDLGTLQAYGAVAAAAVCAGLTAEQVSNAFGLVSATAPVPLARKPRAAGQGRSDIKSAYGYACAAALAAVHLTISGFRGPADALEEPMWAWERADHAEGSSACLAGRLGEEYLIKHVEFKPYPACRFLHSTLEAVELAMDGVDVRVDEIVQIEVHSYRLLGDAYHHLPRPSSPTDAQFSVPYCVSCLIHGGKLLASDFTESAIRRPEVLNLASRLRWYLHPQFDSEFPGRLGSHVVINLSGGSRLEGTVEHPRGSADRPLSEEELTSKFMALSEPALGDLRAVRLMAVIDQLESLRSVAVLSDLMGS
jgi:2-methylcitrate dehydratase PrpD